MRLGWETALGGDLSALKTQQKIDDMSRSSCPQGATHMAEGIRILGGDYWIKAVSAFMLSMYVFHCVQKQR